MAYRLTYFESLTSIRLDVCDFKHAGRGLDIAGLDSHNRGLHELACVKMRRRLVQQ